MEQYKYDPSIFDKIKISYSEGNYVVINKWKWVFSKDHKATKEVISETECKTLDKFEEEIWDLFSDFSDENISCFVWGAFGLKNENPKRTRVGFYDGMIFYLISNEFMGCVKERTVSRFLSCLTHFGYYNLDLLVKKLP